MNKNVALIVETSTNYGRDLLAGILRFMRMKDNWSVFLEQRDLSKKPPYWLGTWKGDGIISRATTVRLSEAVRATGIPFVDLTDRKDPSCDQIQIRSDDAAIGTMAAKHFIERGFVRFGFCGYSSEAWSHRREVAFARTVQEEGHHSTVYRSPLSGPGTRTWASERKRLADWLSEIPRPFAIMACNDMRGQHVLDACQLIGLNVPEEVSVSGVDNDELLCNFCQPPMSSVMANAEGVGFRAAETLSRLMNGETVSEKLQIIPPLAVATRQSTDVVAIDDRQIARSLQFIRENACHGISVSDVTSASGVSRSTLERKLRKLLGRSPQEEIRFVQVRKAKELLSVTDLAIEKIATLTGFQHPEYLHVVFKRLTGMTLGEFRKSIRPKSPTHSLIDRKA